MDVKVLFRIYRRTPEEVQVHYITRSSFTIGRSKDCDVICDHRGVSRKHVRFHIKGRQILVEDLGTSNGSLIDGVKLAPHRLMEYTPESDLNLGTCPDVYSIEVYRSHLSVEEEASEIYRSSKEQALEIRQKAQEEAQRLLVLAQQDMEKQRLLRLEQNKEIVFEIKEKAQEEANDIISRARIEAQEVHNKELELLKTQSLTEVQNLVEEEKQIIFKKAREDVQIECSHLLQEAQEEANSLLQRAQANIKKQKEEIREEIEAEVKNRADAIALEIEKEALAKSETIISNAQKEYQNTLQQAREERQSLFETLQKDQEVKLSQKKDILDQDYQKRRSDFEEEMLSLKEQLTLEHQEKTEKERSKILNETRKTAENERTHLLQEAQDQAASILEKVEKDLEEQKIRIREEIQKEIEDRAQAIELKESQVEQDTQKLMAKTQKEISSMKSEAALKIKTSYDKQKQRQESLEKKHEEKIIALRLEQSEEAQRLQLKTEKRIDNYFEKRASEISDEVQSLLTSRLSNSTGLYTSHDISKITEEIKDHLHNKLTGQDIHEDPEHLKELFKSHLTFGQKLSPQKKKYAMGMMAGVLLVGLLALPQFFSSNKESLSPSASDVFVQRVKAQRQKNKFSPKKTKGFKDSYTKNVLYTKNYLKIQNNEKYKDQWILAVNHFFVNEMGLPDNTVVRFIALESKLIKKLTQLSQHIDGRRIASGVVSMATEEDKFVKKIKALLKKKNHYKKFISFRKKFFNDFTRRTSL